MNNHNAKEFTRKMLKDIAVELGDLFDVNFETKSFFGRSWAARKMEGKGSLLMRTGKLRRSIRRKIDGDSIRFTSALPYAAIHNEGGVILVTKKMKSYFKCLYHEAKPMIRRTMKGELSKSKANQRLDAKLQFYLYMGWIAKEGSKITIPQRQFIGDAPEVRTAVEKVIKQDLKPIEKHIKNILTPKNNKK